MNIVVLAGGTSTERDVSFSSGKGICQALIKNGHHVILLDVYLGVDLSEEEKARPLTELFTSGRDWIGDLGTIRDENPDIEAVKALRKDGNKSFFGPNVIALCQAADVVFLALHGENGENGKIQACFDLLGIAYTGTDYVSSAMAMDKGITKDIFRTYGIRTPEGILFDDAEYEELGGNPSEVIRTKKIGFPVIVKACCGGSSIGVAIARTPEDFGDALKEAFRYDHQIVIEQFIEGREFSICVLDGKALPVIEIAPKVGFYDYRNKYQAGATVETCPADLPEELATRMQDTAVAAFHALRLKCYARFDFRLDTTTNEFYCLEGNTLPGMTPTSLIPQEAAAAGISYEELCEKLVKMAVKDNG